MSAEMKKAWAAPSLETIDMLDTAVKSPLGTNESGKGVCGPATNPTPNCS